MKAGYHGHEFRNHPTRPISFVQRVKLAMADQIKTSAVRLATRKAVTARLMMVILMALIRVAPSIWLVRIVGESVGGLRLMSVVAIQWYSVIWKWSNSARLAQEWELELAIRRVSWVWVERILDFDAECFVCHRCHFCFFIVILSMKWLFVVHFSMTYCLCCFCIVMAII